MDENTRENDELWGDSLFFKPAYDMCKRLERVYNDKENKTITFNQLYTFDSAMLDEWKSFLESARTEYNDGLAEGQTIADNDEQLFSNCTEMVELAKTLIG